MLERKKMGCLVPILIIFLLLAGFLAAVFALHIPTSWTALHLLEQAFDDDTVSGTISVNAQGQKLEAAFYWCEILDERYACISGSDMALYYHEDALFFENGRGYDLRPLTDRVDEFEPAILLLAGFQKISIEEADFYALTLNDDKIEIIKRLIPSVGPHLEEYKGAQLILTEQNGILTGITLRFPDSVEAAVYLRSDSTQSIPTEVLMKIDERNLMPLSSVEPLIRACISLAQQNTFGADATLDVVCGPLPISDTAQIYGTGNDLYLVRNGSVHELGSSFGASEIALALGWELCKSGSIQTVNGIHTYSVNVDAGMLQEIFEAVLPEIQGLGIEFDDGTASVTVTDAINTLSLSSSGNMPFLITRVPIQVDIQLDLMDGAVALPSEIG